MRRRRWTIDGYVEEVKVAPKQPASLFHHPELAVTLSSVADDEPKPVEVIDAVAEDVHTEVTEDTVTIEEEPIIETKKPDVVLPEKATTSSNAKKKPNKKK